MKIDEKTISKVANLAKLHLSEVEMGHYQKELSEILTLAEQIAQVDTAGITPLAHPLEVSQPLRADVAAPITNKAAIQQLSSDTSDEYYIVPKVI